MSEKEKDKAILTPRVIDLLYAARRVCVESDWTEWTDLRDAIEAIQNEAPQANVPEPMGTREPGSAYSPAVASPEIRQELRAAQERIMDLEREVLELTAKFDQAAVSHSVPIASYGPNAREDADKIEDTAPSVTRQIDAAIGHDAAQKRIEECVREIEVLCDAFGYDPVEWLSCTKDYVPNRTTDGSTQS